MQLRVVRSTSVKHLASTWHNAVGHLVPDSESCISESATDSAHTPAGSFSHSDHESSNDALESEQT